MNSSSSAIVIQGLGVRYGRRQALAGLDLAVGAGELFGVMGPNGAGKTTLFRVLATLLPPSAGRATVAGHDVVGAPHEVRRRIGVVFQSNTQDPLLTLQENLTCAAQLYGLGGSRLHERCDEMLRRLGLLERRRDRAGTLSGGMKRRLELARALLHDPPLLLMDEPSAGLDPAGRAELWAHLSALRARGITMFVATHDLDEAERCDRLAVFDRGRCVALDAPAALRGAVGDEVVVLECDDPAGLAGEARARFQLPASAVAGEVRIEVSRAHEWVSRLYDTWPGRFRSLTVRLPTLEDAFVRLTGHRFQGEQEPAPRGSTHV